MKKINLLIFMLTLSLFFSFTTKDTLNNDTIEKRVTILEQFKENMTAVAKIEYDKSANKLKDDIDEKYKNLLWVFGTFTLAAVAALGLNAYNHFWGINKKINEKITSKIEDIIEQKREDIISIIRNEEYERKLKQTKKILVISPSQETQEQIKHTFARFNFSNVKYRIKDSFQEIPENDIVVFNNLKGELSQAYINQIVSTINHEEKCYIGYSIVQLDRHEQFNFANSRFTLYHQLLNTLKFSDLSSQI